MEKQFNLVFIRHGATKSNREHRYLGSADESLLEDGIDKLKENLALKKYPQPDIVFSSPMIRCQETAKLLYPDKQALLIPEWREMNFGDFEGKNFEELKSDQRYQEWINSNGCLPFPNGEDRKEFIVRSVNGLQKMIEQLRSIEAETVVMVVHGGTIMAILSHCCGGEYFDYQVDNGNGYLCKVTLLGNKIRFLDLKKIYE